jgi:NADPH:quinone reductase-like Zn-dependent oxidoreductase
MRKEMKAVVIRSYGSPNVLEEAVIDIPRIRKREMLVEVHAAGVNPLDWKIRKGMMRLITGRKFPKVLGSDFAGKVVETGDGVVRFRKGDEVFGVINILFRRGGYAEYAVVADRYACRKPDNLSFVEAAGIPGSAITAYQVLQRKAKLGPGQHLLINGASGGVGTFAIQIAKTLGAIVTAVCSGKNSGLVSSLGADSVIDYTVRDFSRGTEEYDVILDTVGNRTFFDCSRVLSRNGLYITIVPAFQKIALTLITALLPGKKCKFVSMRPKARDLAWLKERIEEQKIRVVIDRTYPLEQAKDAHYYLEKGHARGKVVLTVRNG